MTTRRRPPPTGDAPGQSDAVAQDLNAAVALHRQGRLGEAEDNEVDALVVGVHLGF